MNFTINKWHLYWDNNDKIREENEKNSNNFFVFIMDFFLAVQKKKMLTMLNQ